MEKKKRYLESGFISVFCVLVLGLSAFSVIAEEDRFNPSSSSLSRVLQPGAAWTEPITGMEFVWVPKGCFQMGQTEPEKQYLIREAGQETYDDSYKSELPRHEVCIDGFWMAKKEVTVAQFLQFVRDTGYRTDADKKGKAFIFNKSTGWDWEERAGHNWENPGFSQTDAHPVTCVSWNDSKAFIDWLSRKTGKTFALPTEAQWEYAARGGTTSMQFWGSVDRAAQFSNTMDKGSNWSSGFPGNDGCFFAAPAGNYQPNPFGLYDMLGNVWEWCEDVYDSNAYSRHGRNNPLITTGSQYRVLRGGSWCDGPDYARSASRLWLAPSFRNSVNGFRLVSPRSGR